MTFGGPVLGLLTLVAWLVGGASTTERAAELITKGRPEEALALVDAALKEEKAPSRALLAMRAAALHRMKRHREETELIRTRLDPSAPESLHPLVVESLFEDFGRTEDASLRDLLRRLPPDPLRSQAAAIAKGSRGPGQWGALRFLDSENAEHLVDLAAHGGQAARAHRRQLRRSGARGARRRSSSGRSREAVWPGRGIRGAAAAPANAWRRGAKLEIATRSWLHGVDLHRRVRKSTLRGSFVNRFSKVVCLLTPSLFWGCGPSGLSFKPSNLPADLALAATEDIIINSESCGPRAEIDTDSGEISCFEPGVFDPKFTYTAHKAVKQSDNSEVTVFVGRNVRVDANNELQIQGGKPLILVALGTMTIGGRITAINAITKYGGEGGGASEPSGSRVMGLGGGGGNPSAADAAGAGGASFCGIGGKGGDDTSPAITGGAGGTAYGTPELVPLKAGSSGGKNGNHSGAGGGGVQLVAGTSIEVQAGAYITMAGRGGGWFGNGAGSGGAILMESETITIAGTLAANGGGGGGGSSAGGENGADGTPNATAAPGGVAGAGGGLGGAGSAGDDIAGAAGQTVAGQAGGGGGGAGRIRLNTKSGTATVSGVISPSTNTACATQGTVTPK
jgi:hypothetical protein